MNATYRYKKARHYSVPGFFHCERLFDGDKYHVFLILTKTRPDVPVHELSGIPISHEMSQRIGKSFRVRYVGRAIINEALASKPAMGIQQITFPAA